MEGKTVTDAHNDQTNTRRKKTKRSHGIPKVAFDRLVREICQEQRVNSKTLWQPEAMTALQEYCETMLERRFHKAQRLADLCRVQTVNIEHWDESDPAQYAL